VIAYGVKADGPFAKKTGLVLCRNLRMSSRLYMYAFVLFCYWKQGELGVGSKSRKADNVGGSRCAELIEN